MDREGEARILVARLKQKLRRSTTLRGALGPAAVIMHCDRVIAYCESINTWLMQGHQRCAWPSCSCRPCLLQKQRLSESAVKMRSSANTWQLSGDESSYEMVVAYESAAVAFFREAVIRLESLRDLSFALRNEIRPPPSQLFMSQLLEMDAARTHAQYGLAFPQPQAQQSTSPQADQQVTPWDRGFASADDSNSDF